MHSHQFPLPSDFHRAIGNSALWGQRMEEIPIAYGLAIFAAVLTVAFAFQAKPLAAPLAANKIWPRKTSRRGVGAVLSNAVSTLMSTLLRRSQSPNHNCAEDNDK